jgi:hypothetical protein
MFALLIWGTFQETLCGSMNKAKVQAASVLKTWNSTFIRIIRVTMIELLTKWIMLGTIREVS